MADNFTPVLPEDESLDWGENGINNNFINQNTLNQELISELNSKADKVIGATNGNLATLNSTGNLVDSGVTLSNVTKVAVSDNDTISKYLEEKLVAGTNVTFAILNEGADESLEISASINWGDIGGTLSDQTDLQNALDAKADLNGDLTEDFSVNSVKLGDNIVTVAVGKTLALADSGFEQKSTSATAIDITVPLNSSVAFPIGTEIPITKYGTGDVTIVATGGVTINTQDSLVIDTQYDSRILKKIATDEWLLKKSSGGGGINYLTEESLKAAEDLIQGDFIEKFGDIAKKVQRVRDDFIENTKYVYDSSAIVRDIVMLTDTKFVVSYVKQVSTGKLWCIIGDIAADNSITYGTRVEYYNTGSSSVDIRYAKLARLADDKFVMVYMGLASGSADYYSSIVSTVSGTVITKGTVYTYDSTSFPESVAVENLNTDKFIIIYDRDDNTEQGIVGTVSGTVISYGTIYQASATGGNINNLALKLTTDKIVMSYGNQLRIASISGTVITYGTAYTKTLSNNLGVLSEDKIILIESGQIQTGDVSATNISFNTQYAVSSTANYIVCFSETCAFTYQQKMVVDASDVIDVGKVYTRTNLANKQINKDDTSYKIVVLSGDGVLTEDVYHKLGFASDNTLSGNTGTFFTENK